MGYAARGCGDHGSTVLEYLVKSGADIYDVKFEGFPPHFNFCGDEHCVDEHCVDEQRNLRLIAGYRVFTSHRDWIPSRPSTRVPYENFKATSDIIDVFPLFRNPREEIICSVLQEMWPPWKNMSPADRLHTLFPEFNVQILTGFISPLRMRACLSHKYIQETFASWDTREKAKLIEYAFDALARELAHGSEKGIEETRLFLKDIHMTNSLINTLPEVDFLCFFIYYFARAKRRELEYRRWRVKEFMNGAQEGLNHYVSELMLLGINMATIIDVERKVLARHGKKNYPRRLYHNGEPYKIIAIDYGLKADDWYLWLSNPLDEWAGEFWDMIDHPERAIPGAWIGD